LVIDKTIIDLISIAITGSGIFAALAEYSSEEINKSYLGSNPHAVKAGIINSVITKFFLAWATLGTLIQVVSIVFEPLIPPRANQPIHYLILFMSLVVFMWLAMKVSVLIAHKVAKRIWYSPAVQSKKASFKNIQESIVKENPAVVKSAEHHLADIESLLEINPKSRNLSDRVKILIPIFESVKDALENEDD